MSNTSDKLFDEKSARSVVPMSLAWFRRRRLYDLPPRFVRIGRRVFYREKDLRSFIESRPAGGESKGQNDA
jgi:hypothetical protein